MHEWIALVMYYVQYPILSPTHSNQCSSFFWTRVLDTPDSLLQTNDLQNKIIDHACFFTCLELPLSVNSIL